jgi:hypothetical protein
MVTTTTHRAAWHVGARGVLLATLLLVPLLASCRVERQPRPARDTAAEPAATGEAWLAGTADQRMRAIERQFGGFSGTMVEVAYRYSELYWAGRDGNWDYAAYQAEHIAEALELGFERRPSRAASGGPFVDHSLPAVIAAIEARDADAFTARFGELTASCNACHRAEDVAYINIVPPGTRLSPTEAPASSP